MARKKNSKQWARLRLLCSSGLDLMTLVPDAFALMQGLIPHSSAGLYMATADGETNNVFYVGPIAGVEHLCTDPDFFCGPYDVPMPMLLRGRGKIGQMFAPRREFYSSNTYQYLMRGAGQHHALDIKLEDNGQPIGMLILLREPRYPFDEDDLEDAARLAMYFEHAFRTARNGSCELASGEVEEEALLVARRDGAVLFASQTAHDRMRDLAAQQRVQYDGSRLPPACRELVGVLTDGERHPWRMPSMQRPIPGGLLSVSAQWLQPGEADGGHEVGILLKRILPRPLRVWRNLSAAVLSPQQSELALWMGLGYGREVARSRMGMSEAVMRDCVRTIYDRLECNSEAALVARLARTERQWQ
jgi:hypothetical protein